ncbi:hypothetical protein [Aneurinibacillus sp. REN35]
MPVSEPGMVEARWHTLANGAPERIVCKSGSVYAGAVRFAA